MGYTTFTKQLVQSVTYNYVINSVLDLGSQNDYDIAGDKPPFISEWFKSKGIDYECIDLAGDNNAWKVDLSKPFENTRGEWNGKWLYSGWDMVVDAGTSEHVVQMNGYESIPFHDGHINSIYPTEVKDVEAGYYNCWLNKFNLCKVGGFIVSENPKHGHWPDHGYHYITQEFYEQLADMVDVEIIKIGEHPASGNNETGMNIFCILRKTGDKFATQEHFWSLPIYKS